MKVRKNYLVRFYTIRYDRNLDEGSYYKIGIRFA